MHLRRPWWAGPIIRNTTTVKFVHDFFFGIGPGRRALGSILLAGAIQGMHRDTVWCPTFWVNAGRGEEITRLGHNSSDYALLYHLLEYLVEARFKGSPSVTPWNFRL